MGGCRWGDVAPFPLRVRRSPWLRSGKRCGATTSVAPRFPLARSVTGKGRAKKRVWGRPKDQPSIRMSKRMRSEGMRHMPLRSLPLGLTCSQTTSEIPQVFMSKPPSPRDPKVGLVRKRRPDPIGARFNESGSVGPIYRNGPEL